MMPSRSNIALWVTEVSQRPFTKRLCARAKLNQCFGNEESKLCQLLVGQTKCWLLGLNQKSPFTRAGPLSKWSIRVPPTNPSAGSLRKGLHSRLIAINRECSPLRRLPADGFVGGTRIDHFESGPALVNGDFWFNPRSQHFVWPTSNWQSFDSSFPKH